VRTVGVTRYVTPDYAVIRVAPRSAIIRMSAAHTGRCTDPPALLEHLLATMVRQAVA